MVALRCGNGNTKCENQQSAKINVKIKKEVTMKRYKS